ncbi:MAG: enoyl-CoA hydratase-related protein [Bacteroidota bacterium]|jgi:enoyl-CoA hydratase|nr:enoyl-CoA hydratase-related protein [Bacteroidota bacterium]
MDFNNILVETTDRIAVITLNRPDKLNALNHDTLVELGAAMDDVNARADVDVIIITGAGEKAFVAGADIKELSAQDAVAGQRFALFGQEVFLRIEQSAKPVIAAVNGFALGGGCELALACHIRIATENAKFGQPEVNLGVIPGYGGTQRLARVIGPGRAAELILTGDMVDAAEAHRIGLVNAVVPRGEARQHAVAMAAKISAKGQPAVRLALQALRCVPQMGLREGLATEAALFGIACGTEDFREGTTAFLEKRPPAFTGR